MAQRNTPGRQDDRQQNQQQDRRPQHSRDPQRNKQSDSGHAQQVSGQNRQQDANRQQGPQDAGSQQGQQNVYGEGNYAASKQYNDATRKFAQSGRVEKAARDAAPGSDADALQMQAAEAEGKRHAKGEDPALNRKSSKLSPDTARAPKPGEEE